MSREIEEVFVSQHGERISIEQFDYEPNSASAYNEIVVDAEGAVKLAAELLEFAGWQPMETALRDGCGLLFGQKMTPQKSPI